ncbi:MAG: RNA polymerase sigma-70 factor [Muribaculaceae bacterium]|nr:RNA polymerase sigma-70 factor [Muribaculaceae bacterium]
MSHEKEFETYFNRYYTSIGMYVMRICDDVEESEDIVQETFSTVWEKFADKELPIHLKSYLYRTAHNITIDRIRSGYKKDMKVPLEEICQMEVTEEAIDTSERDARLWIAIGKLPERCRQVFLLSKRDGMTHAEIAKELGISVKTVENQITKAFKYLREVLEPSKGKVFFLPFL